MLAEALEPDRGVEAFHVGIIGRLAGAAEVQRDAVGCGAVSRHEILELRPAGD